MSRPFAKTSAIVLLVVALVHVYRIYAGWSVVVGGHDIPILASWVGAAIAGALGLGLLAEARR